MSPAYQATSDHMQTMSKNIYRYVFKRKCPRKPMSTQTAMVPFKGQSVFIDYCLQITIMELGFPKGKALDAGIHSANVLNLCFIFIVV